MKSLNIYAGDTARQKIQQEGFGAHLFDAFLGASGGPKWFSLAGLDKIMFSEFFNDPEQHIDIMGSSAGAFRAACLAQNDPRAAITRLANQYSSTVYSAKPSANEITQTGYVLLNHMLSASGAREILHASNRTVHFFVAQCHGWVASEHKQKQLMGLLKAGSRNMLARKSLAKSFSRAVFSSRIKADLFHDPESFPTKHYSLTEQNLVTALMASGSIPMVIEGVKDIPGAAQGMYRDGGIIDYHFDLRFNTKGLILYPHFYKTPTPGWFDKNLLSRQCHPSSYDNVVMLVPSDEFVAALPYGKIPDRKDFETMDAEQRIPYWQKVIQETDRLGDEFLSKVADQSIIQEIKPIQLARK